MGSSPSSDLKCIFGQVLSETPFNHLHNKSRTAALRATAQGPFNVSKEFLDAQCKILGQFSLSKLEPTLINYTDHSGTWSLVTAFARRRANAVQMSHIHVHWPGYGAVCSFLHQAWVTSLKETNHYESFQQHHS